MVAEIYGTVCRPTRRLQSSPRQSAVGNRSRAEVKIAILNDLIIAIFIGAAVQAGDITGDEATNAQRPDSRWAAQPLVFMP